MGINNFFEKAISFVTNIVGTETCTGIKRTAKKASSLLSASTCSIGSILSKVFNEDEVGDKLELSTKNERKTQDEKIKKDCIIEEKQEKAATVAGATKTNAINKIEDNVNTKKQNNKPATEEDLNKVRKAIREKCNESGIDFAQLAINMAALTGKTFVEFSKLDKGLQISLLKYIMQSIDNVNKAAVPGVKKLDAVVTDAALMYYFVTHDKTGKAIDIENITPEELAKRREVFNAKLKLYREEKEAKIAKLPEEQRMAAREALKEELAGYRKHIFDELRKKIPFESAIELILILSVKNLGKAAKELMESYPVEIREKIANTLQSPESFKEYLRTMKDECNELTKDELNAIQQFHRIFGTYKTKENLEAYEAVFQESRKNEEFSEDIYKATEMGIGEAAYANIKMTSQEKEAFIQNWVSNNSSILSDSDMAEVERNASEYIKEVLEKNPELKENFAKVKSSIKEIVEKTLNRVFEEKKAKYKEASKKITKEQKENCREFTREISIPSVKACMVQKEVLSHAQQYIKIQAEKFATPSIKKSIEQIEFALVTGIIDEKQALKNLDNSEHKFIKMCVQNPRLASKYDERINLYIKSEKDKEKLKAIAAVAPHDMVIKIVENMRGDKQKLTSELIKHHEVDFNTKVLLTKYTEEHAA